MELKEVSQGIWGLVGDGVKETYRMICEPVDLSLGRGCGTGCGHPVF